SNGRIDDSIDGRGKGEWTGDNQQTAASFFLVYNPNGRPQAIRNQIGFMRPDASVETASSPAANNVNQLVQTVLLNYMALHGEQSDFGNRFAGHGLGNSTMQDSLIAMSSIVTGTI
ncbi:MAG: general secretion pathway protein GspF, partial [Gammaproteobacteria bacterium]